MNDSRMKKLTLLLLCWFFGLFGLHRFVAGKRGTASMQLGALLLFGLFALLDWGWPAAILIGALGLSIIVDAALIIAGRFTDKDGLRVVQWV